MEHQFKLKSLLVLPLVTILTACGSSDSNEKATNNEVAIVNNAPLITSEAVTSAIEDNTYTYLVEVQDDGDDLTFTLSSFPEGMSISETGLIEWLPTEGVLSSGEVVVAVNDGENDNVIQSFEVVVTPVNDTPVLSLIPNQTVKSGDDFSFQLVLTDPDDNIENGDFSFSVSPEIEGMEIDQNGLITYQARASETTEYNLTVEVRDGQEDGVLPVRASFILDEQFFKGISAVIKNYYTEDVIPNADAFLTNGNEILADSVSDENGIVTFSIQDIYITERMSIISDASGFAEMAIGLNEEQIDLSNNILLQPVQAEISFDPTIENNLSVEDFVLVELPANSLQRADGALATGLVNAELTIINPAIDINLMPGEMITKDVNGEIKPIESFGAITVTFEDADGVELNLTENMQAKINIPAVGELDGTVPLYYFDNNSGLWIEEGQVELVSGPQGNYYSGMVSHFTTWNADRIYETIFINGCIEDKDQNRLEGVQINSEGRDYIGSSSAVTDENGDFSIPAKMNSTVLISSSAGIQSRTFSIDTFNTDITLSECVVLNEAFTKIKLNWGLMPTDLDSHLWGPSSTNGEQFHIYFGNEQVIVNDVVMFLDVDDVTSYGPEVISIPEFALPGTYSYKVHNYSGTPEIDSDTTKVELLIDDRRYVFTPPSEGADEMWHVFDLIVSEVGNVQVNKVDIFEPYYFYSSNSLVPNSNIEPKIKYYESIYNKLITGKYYAK